MSVKPTFCECGTCIRINSDVVARRMHVEETRKEDTKDKKDTKQPRKRVSKLHYNKGDV